MSAPVAQLEPWLDKKALARHLGCSERWIEYRIKDSLPAYRIAGRAKFKASECEAWLAENGHLVRVGEGQR